MQDQEKKELNKETHDFWLSQPLKLGIFYHKPGTMHGAEWAKWEKKVAAKYPFQYLFREFFPALARLTWANIEMKFYYLKCYLFKRYNVIKIRSLSPTWHDTDVLLEESIEQLYVDFIEKEKPFETVDYDYDERTKNQKKILEKIYNYIKKDKSEMQKQIEKLYDEARTHNKGDILEMLDPDAKTSNIYQEIYKLENQLYIKTSENLASIIVYRSYLWT